MQAVLGFLVWACETLAAACFAVGAPIYAIAMFATGHPIDGLKGIGVAVLAWAALIYLVIEGIRQDWTDD